MVFQLHTGVCLQVTFYHLCTLSGIFSCYCLVAIAGFVSVALVYINYGTQCGETSTTLAETQSSVSSVGVQSKGFHIVFLVIKMSLFPTSV